MSFLHGPSAKKNLYTDCAERKSDSGVSVGDDAL